MLTQQHEDFNLQTLKKIYSKNNNEIVLLESGGIGTRPYIILIIGVFHGDEPQGKFLIENYLKNVRVQSKNRMLFIPCLNPDGLERKTRQNTNGVDLNRNFPTKNWAENLKITEKNEFYGGESATSEIETKFVVEIIEEFSPDVILTLHAPFKVVNYDGPAKEIAQKISEIINYPVQHDIGYPTPGSFGTYAGVERNIPTITLELDENIDIAELMFPIKEIFNYLASY